jgi:hypothetical protein
MVGLAVKVSFWTPLGTVSVAPTRRVSAPEALRWPSPFEVMSPPLAVQDATARI